ncbi:MAG: hypothetical protein ACN6O8_21090 [Achromobacter sp.]|uniref:hypothetical protein n=1 Tax=Achromobacter sp. TaxID=134375 RepID=UPI003CFBCC71
MDTNHIDFIEDLDTGRIIKMVGIDTSDIIFSGTKNAAAGFWNRPGFYYSGGLGIAARQSGKTGQGGRGGAG